MKDNRNNKLLSREDIIDLNVYEKVWTPLDDKEEDIRHLIKNGLIRG